MKTFALASIAMLSLIGMGSAYADDVSVPTTVVKYGDLDLTHAAGAAVLYQRLNQAARKVCAPLDIPQSAITKSEPYKACLSKAISGAVAKIDKPEFTAYVAKKISPESIKLASR